MHPLRLDPHMCPRRQTAPRLSSTYIRASATKICAVVPWAARRVRS
jgi:hypothetical protein